MTVIPAATTQLMTELWMMSAKYTEFIIKDICNEYKLDYGDLANRYLKPLVAASSLTPTSSNGRGGKSGGTAPSGGGGGCGC